MTPEQRPGGASQSNEGNEPSDGSRTDGAARLGAGEQPPRPNTWRSSARPRVWTTLPEGEEPAAAEPVEPQPEQPSRGGIPRISTTTAPAAQDPSQVTGPGLPGAPAAGQGARPAPGPVRPSAGPWAQVDPVSMTQSIPVVPPAGTQGTQGGQPPTQDGPAASARHSVSGPSPQDPPQAAQQQSGPGASPDAGAPASPSLDPSSEPGPTTMPVAPAYVPPQPQAAQPDSDDDTGGLPQQPAPAWRPQGSEGRGDGFPSRRAAREAAARAEAARQARAREARLRAASANREGDDSAARPSSAAPGSARGARDEAAQPGTPPSAADLVAARAGNDRNRQVASSGWRKAFGMGPGKAELLEHARADRISRPLGGRRTVMVINTKGGGGKTLVTLMLATYLGRHRSGSVLAWDNNETEGTLGMRAPGHPHHRTVVDLLAALPGLEGNPSAGDELGNFVREQPQLSFDVLASADDDEAMRIIGEEEFERLHALLSRYYRMIVIDTGNNRLAPNWLAAAAKADMLVFATSLKDDTSVVAAKNLDALVAMGREDLVRNAVCVISHTTSRADGSAGQHTRAHFERWVRRVVDIPFDPALAPGLQLDPTKINKRTHEACMEVAAAVVDGL